MNKYCPSCKENKDVGLFYSDLSRSDGVSGWCKACVRKKRKTRRDKNLKVYREREREARKRYYKKNKRKVLDSQKAYVSAWIKDHPEEAKQYSIKAQQKRRAWKKNAGIFLITKKEVSKILSGSCYLCGSKKNQTMDHIIPLSRGGRHSIGNLGTLCHSCNSRKRNKLLMEIKNEQFTRSNS